MAASNKYKKTERILYDYKFLQRYIELRKKDLEELNYNGVHASALSLAKSANTVMNDPVSKEFFDIEKVRYNWEKSIKEKEKIIHKINKALELLNRIEKKIIEMRYFDCKRIYIIADRLGYSERQINRIKKNAINKISIVLWGK